MHPLLNAVGRSFGDAQELDAKPKFVRGAQIGERDGLDSFDRNSAASILAPNASEARIASLCAVSKPPTSNVGSASA